MNKENDNQQRQQGQQVNPISNAIKDPDDWKTGDEPMTGAQNSYLHTLASEAGEEVDGNLTKAEAAKKIDELQQKTGRGLDNNNAESQSERRDRNEEQGLRGGKSSV